MDFQPSIICTTFCRVDKKGIKNPIICCFLEQTLPMGLLAQP